MNAQDVLTLTLALGGTPEDADEIHQKIKEWSLREQATFALLTKPSAIARSVRGLLTQVRYERNGGRSANAASVSATAARRTPSKEQS